MTPRVTVIDYGLGNLFSVRRAFTHVGAEVEFATTGAAVRGGAALVLPGVGAFGDGMRQLEERGLVESIRATVEGGRPLLGICLGMQLLFDEGDEFGVHRGLSLMGGRVGRLAGDGENGARVKVPHVGWAALRPTDRTNGWESTVLQGIATGAAMYFVHSYAPAPADKALSVADIDFGGRRYCAVVQRDSVMGCQFHPERSAADGLRILDNFVRGKFR